MISVCLGVEESRFFLNNYVIGTILLPVYVDTCTTFYLPNKLLTSTLHPGPLDYVLPDTYNYRPRCIANKAIFVSTVHKEKWITRRLYTNIYQCWNVYHIGGRKCSGIMTMVVNVWNLTFVEFFNSILPYQFLYSLFFDNLLCGRLTRRRSIFVLEGFYTKRHPTILLANIQNVRP